MINYQNSGMTHLLIEFIIHKKNKNTPPVISQMEMNCFNFIDFITFHDIASSESVYTMISYKLEEIQETQKFKVLKSNKKYNQSNTYYMGQNHIDDESKISYEIDKIEIYDAQVKTTVFNRKTVKTVKMIDFYWKGKN